MLLQLGGLLKGDVPVGECNEPVVGDGDPMGIGAKIIAYKVILKITFVLEDSV
jgi:hypothetical protein